MEQQFTTFCLDAYLFGIEVQLVREVDRNCEITIADRAPPHVAGLMNLRGQIVTVLDLRTRLGFSAAPSRQDAYCIVLKTGTGTQRQYATEGLRGDTIRDPAGLLIDRIGDMVTLDAGQIQPPPANFTGADNRFIRGVALLERQLLAVLRLDTILALT